MRRRTFLRSGVAALAAGTATVAVADRTRSYGPMGELQLAGAKELVTDDRGIGYVAVTDGFATVDLADPTAPELLAERRPILAEEGGPLTGIFDVKHDDGTLAVAGPAQSGQFRAFALYDVGDPAEPQRIGYTETGTPIHNCAFQDGYVYLTGNGLQGNPMVVYDAADGSPEKVAEWSLLDHEPAWRDVYTGLYNLHDLYVRGGYAYLAYWDAGAWILDVSDPTAPAYVSNVGPYAPEDLADLSGNDALARFYEPPGNAHYTAVDDDGTLLGVGAEAWEVDAGTDDGGPGGIDLWDVSDPASPAKLSTIAPTDVDDATQGTGTWTTAHNFELHGGRLYSSWYQDGVKVHDVSDPAEPELLAHWRRPGETSFWTAQVVEPGEYFVASDASYTLPGADGTVKTFPDEQGTQEDQPPLEADPTPTATPDVPTTGVPPTTVPPSTDAGTPDGTPTDTATVSGTEEDSPGFGALAAVGGLSLAGLRMFRERNE